MYIVVVMHKCACVFDERMITHFAFDECDNLNRGSFLLHFLINRGYR